MSRSRGNSDSSGLTRMSPIPAINETTSDDVDTSAKLYLLNIFLQNGRNLPIRDASGSSDPYVKFFYKNKLIYQSHTVFKNLNPQWDEKFCYVVDDITVPLKIEVWDYDRYSNDDFIGFAVLELFKLDSNPIEARVDLVDKKPTSNDKREELGYLTISMQLLPAADATAEEALRKRHSSQEADDPHDKKNSKRSKKAVRQGSKMWTELVRVVLIEARKLVEPKTNSVCEIEHPPDTFVRFQLGDVKHKSKIIYNTWNPHWLEQFSMAVRDEEDRILEVALVDKNRNDFIGKCAIDLTQLQSRKVENSWYRLDNGMTEILLSLTYSGKLASRTVSVCDSEDGLVHRFDEAATGDLIQSYEMKNWWRNLWDVGFLTVKVHKARGLKGGDLVGSSDPFCVVELCNARLETHTEHKTKNPEWFTIFTFFVNDIHSILEVSVFDEDRMKKSELLGKVCIPLLNVVNNEPIWYPLKNHHLTRRVKGEILLEINVNWNPIRGALATFLPPEKKYGIKEDPFRPRICLRNLERLNRFGVLAFDWYQYWQLCLSWEKPQQSIMAFLACLIGVAMVQPWMIPLGPLLLFIMVYYRKQEVGDPYQGTAGVAANGAKSDNISLSGGIGNTPEDATFYDKEEEEEMDEEDETTDERNWKIIRSYVRYKEVSLFYLQNVMDLTATFLEKVKNILEFKQPFVSWLAIFSLLMGVVVMFLIPLRYLAIAWVVKKFTRKIRRPYMPPSNELLDFIARAPSDIDLKSYYGYKRDAATDEYINEKIFAHAANRKRGRKWYERVFGIRKKESMEE